MPTRGSPIASSRASGCWASQSISALTSRTSASGESTCTVPPEEPKPRASQVSTLKPALRSGPSPTLPVCSLLALLGSVSREPPQPWPSRTVGAFWPGARPSAGKKESTICVPSNDVTVASRAWAAGASASDAAVTARVRATGRRAMAFGWYPLTRVLVARERDGHLVLQAVRVPRLDAVHQEREGQAAAAEGRAVADERGDVVQRAGLGVAAVLRRRAPHAVVHRAVAPHDGQRGIQRRAGRVIGHPGQQPHHLARRRAVQPREAGAVHHGRG